MTRATNGERRPAVTANGIELSSPHDGHPANSATRFQDVESSWPPNQCRWRSPHTPRPAARSQFSVRRSWTHRFPETKRSNHDNKQSPALAPCRQDNIGQAPALNRRCLSASAASLSSCTISSLPSRSSPKRTAYPDRQTNIFRRPTKDVMLQRLSQNSAAGDQVNPN